MRFMSGSGLVSPVREGRSKCRCVVRGWVGRVFSSLYFIFLLPVGNRSRGQVRVSVEVRFQARLGFSWGRLGLGLGFGRGLKLRDDLTDTGRASKNKSEEEWE